MRLVFSASAIIIKRSLCALAAALLCLSLTAAAVAACFVSGPPQPVRLAIINEDDSTLLLPMVTSMLESRLEGLLTAEVVGSAAEAEGCAAILTLPEGFFESVMTGENLPPSLTVNVSSPLEGLWVSCLAKSAAQTLSSAQNAVGALNFAISADGIPAPERDRLLFSVNSRILNDYLTRRGRFESVSLSATGSVTAAQYYLAAGASFLLFVMVFLLFSPINELKAFAALSRAPARCFAAAFISCLLLSMLLTGAAVLAMGGRPGRLFSPAALAASLLLGCVMLFFPSVSPDPAGCAALSAGLCLIQAVLGGAILPEPLLPAPLLALSGMLPLSALRRLLADAAFGCGFSGAAAVMVWCVALAAGSALCWLGRGEAR